jgi:small subunit ribosomal protein S15
MGLSTERKAEIVDGFRRGANDTGSPEVQIALLSARITDLARKSYRTSEKEESADPWEAEVYNSQEKFTEAYLKAGMHERVKGHVAP